MLRCRFCPANCFIKHRDIQPTFSTHPSHRWEVANHYKTSMYSNNDNVHCEEKAKTVGERRKNKVDHSRKMAQIRFGNTNYGQLERTIRFKMGHEHTNMNISHIRYTLWPLADRHRIRLTPTLRIMFFQEIEPENLHGVRVPLLKPVRLHSPQLIPLGCYTISKEHFECCALWAQRHLTTCY